jgi:hypothetical protein
MPENSRSKTVISIDGRTDIVSADKGYSLLEIIKQLADLLVASNRTILSARADGRPVFLAENRDLLNKKVDEFSLVEVETIDIRAQAVNALREVRGHVPGLSKALLEVTKNIQAGEVLKGYKSLATCADVLNLIVHVIDEVRALLGVDLTSVQVDGSTVSAQLEGVRDVLRDAKKALDTNDIVTVADLMEYELAPRIRKWDDMLDTLLKTVESSPR